jgi:hypothetical protein
MTEEMTLEQKVDKVLENQEYLTKLLEGLLELIPPRKGRPNIQKALEPILNSPAMKNNPMVSQVMANFMKEMGEDNE